MRTETDDIQVGDRYVRGDLTVEITSVTATHVGYVVKGGMGVDESELKTLADFKIIEERTFRNGAKFIPVTARKGGAK